MSYDSNLDKVLFTKTHDLDDCNNLEVSVRSYNGGPPRIQMGRNYRRSKEHGWYKPMRRSSTEHTKVIIKLLNAAVKAAEKIEAEIGGTET